MEAVKNWWSPLICRQVPPSLVPIPLYSSMTMACRTSSIISQLCTSPSPLNTCRYKAGFITSPACTACGAASESRAYPSTDHFIQHTMPQVSSVHSISHLSLITQSCSKRWEPSWKQQAVSIDLKLVRNLFALLSSPSLPFFLLLQYLIHNLT